MKNKLNLLKEFAARTKVGDYPAFFGTSEKIYKILPDLDKHRNK
jgi:hypothetical protein